jgi:hypothetical protein
MHCHLLAPAAREIAPVLRKSKSCIGGRRKWGSIINVRRKDSGLWMRAGIAVRAWEDREAWKRNFASSGKAPRRPTITPSKGLMLNSFGERVFCRRSGADRVRPLLDLSHCLLLGGCL